MRSRRGGAAAAVLAALLLVSAADGPPKPASETLVVFIQETGTAVAKRFRETHLPALRRTAEETGMALIVRDVAGGAPREVAITPLVIFQNHRGRSIYQGRYRSLEMLRHFIRTSRQIPQGSEPLILEGHAILREGRAVVAAPLKITDLTGALPEGFDQGAFKREAAAWVRAGFERLEAEHSADLGRAARFFYMDIHPYLSEEGSLYLSLALYSQFDCIEPVFIRTDDPVTGPWSERANLFATAARALEAALLDRIAEPATGDGFDPVPASTPEASWESLVLALPQAPDGESAAPAREVRLGRLWEIEPAVDGDAPRLQFRFLPPMDTYSGEVGVIRGTLRLAEDRSLRSATGWVEALSSSVTMGDKGLDKMIVSKVLGADRFPGARFTTERIDAPERPLAFGHPTDVEVQGSFEMIGIEVPMDVRARIEPVLGDDGRPRLHVTAAARIRLKEPFGIEGPIGSWPASDTLVFYLDFMMAEESMESAEGSAVQM